MIYIISTLEVLLTLLVMLLVYTAIFFIGYFIREKFLTYYYIRKDKKFRQKAEKNYEEYLQRKHRRELRRKERERYPLFYWKDGIVQ